MSTVSLSREVCRLGCAVCLFVFGVPTVHAQWVLPNPITSVQQEADGLTLAMKTGTLRLQVCTDSVVHVIYSPTAVFPERKEFAVIKTSWAPVPWTLDSSAKDVTLSTSRLRVAVAREDGSITYSDSLGRRLLLDQSKTLTSVTVNGEKAYHAEDFFNIYGSQEALYGLGQYQAGVWNYRGEEIDLAQDNSNIAIPLLLSSLGYGIFWNNSSRSRVNNRFANYLYISSEVADAIDYYFFFGPEFDTIIGEYRDLTGQAPLFGKWAYGFWQCKNRYKSQEELLSVAHKYRDQKIPIDNIVQDWFWWNRKGEHVFNKSYPDPRGMVEDLHRNHFHLMISVWPFFEPGSAEYSYMDKQGWFIAKTRYPKPPYHAGQMALYDAFNPAARKYYWQLMDNALFDLGIDAWWLDTTEPETEGQEDNIMVERQVAIGSGARYANLFPLMTTTAVYSGQRQASEQKRVFILSRSAFAGTQRNAVTVWSGDINSDWFTFRRQIPAGLNFSLSGLPYWTTDIGGFLDGNPDDPAYRELFIRWFQYGTFCPIFRVHGTRSTNQNELWSYGQPAEEILTGFDTLRYRLLPYIYSVAWQVTKNSYTPMRPLAMDFRNDRRALNIGDEFLFGPAFLVNPVTQPDVTTRRLYLPNARWYDFWTGHELEGGREIDSAAPLDRLPLYLRAGSIVPMGPELEYATQRPEDPIELRVYRGADGDFTLYEDENDNYDYEKGVHATIAFHWNDSSATLTIGRRNGSFPGMLQARTFNVVLVGGGHGAGIHPDPRPDRIVQYSGAAQTLQF